MAASLTSGRARVLENDSHRHLGPSRAEIETAAASRLPLDHRQDRGEQQGLESVWGVALAGEIEFCAEGRDHIVRHARALHFAQDTKVYEPVHRDSSQAFPASEALRQVLATKSFVGRLFCHLPEHQRVDWLHRDRPAIPAYCVSKAAVTLRSERNSTA